MQPEQNSVKKNLRKELDLIFVKNPVLVTGLALAPAVVGGFTVKNGLGLSLVFGMVTIPVLVLASFLGMLSPKVPQYVRTIAYVVLAALMLIPARMLASGIAPNLFDSLGMYFSAMALNTVWLIRAPLCQEKKPQWALWEGVCQTLGVSVCILAVSAVRELLSYGTFWGNPTFLSVKFPAMAYAFGGFIVVGVTAAVLRWGIDRVHDIARLAQRQQQKWRVER
ncbi:MAG: Rnf-Nqr domain containing protein [Oscillospiraceae bacterium]|nr:Rnf-Nqr domain containing protein [Oscillospiraceae bacterium]